MKVKARPAPRAHDLPAGLSGELLFSTLLRSRAGGMIVSHLDDATIVEVNDGFVDLIGYAREELIGRTTSDLQLVAPEARNALLAALGDDGHVRDLELALRTKFGTFRDVLVSSDVVQGDGQAYLLTIVHDVTEQNSTEDDIRRSHDRLRQVFESSPVPTFIKQVADGRVVLANPACLELLGWNPEELAGRTLDELGAWADPERPQQLLDELQARGRVREAEATMRAKSGELLQVLVSFELVDLDDEQCLVAQFVDISERKRAEEALHAAEERYRELFEKAAIGIAYTTIDGRPIELNQAWAALVGYESPEQFMREVPNAGALYHDPAEREALASKVTERGSASNFEVRLRRRDGALIWVALTVRPITDNAGAIVGMHGSGVDVSDRRHAEEALRESEERFRLLAESSTDMISRHHPDGRLLYISPACRRLLGYEPDDLVGRRVIDLVHPDDRAELEARQIRDSTDPTAIVTEVFRYLRSDGAYTWVESAVTGIPDPRTGHIVEFQASTRDVSERVQAERETRLHLAALEVAVQELDAFSYSVSHDLRAPLRAIDGFSRIVIDEHAENLDAEGLQYLGRVSQGVRKMGDLIDGLLAFSRLGQQQLDKRTVGVERLAREVVREIAAGDPERSIEIEVGPLADAEADPTLLRQVLANLVANAFKYTRDAESARIEIDSHDEGGATVYTVRDNGVGFDMQYGDKLFQVFQRLHRSEDYEGIGIGLALVDRIVRRHGGRIWAESAPGCGATFSFTLAQPAA
jgi:PAS domain S-box-containing protein